MSNEVKRRFEVMFGTVDIYAANFPGSARIIDFLDSFEGYDVLVQDVPNLSDIAKFKNLSFKLRDSVRQLEKRVTELESNEASCWERLGKLEGVK